MKKFSLLFLAAFIVFSLSAEAADDSKYFKFLKNTYDNHDPKLIDFLKAELETFINLFPGSDHCPDAHHYLAQVYLDDGDKHQALGIYLKTLFIYPGDKNHDASVTNIRSIIAKGTGYKKQKEKIIGLLNSPFKKDSESDGYYRFLEFLYELGQSKLYRWSLKEYYGFLAKFPEHDQIDRVHRWIAGTYASLGDDKAAVTAYLKYEHLYPENVFLPLVKIRRAVVLYKELKSYDEAIDVLTEVIDDYPGTDYGGEALFHRADIKARKLKDYHGAIGDLNKLVETMPDHHKSVDALFKVASIKHAKLKAYISAIETYDAIASSYPDDSRAARALKEAAKLHTKIKEPEKAATKYALISELYPNSENAPEMLAKAASISERKLKDYERAIEYYMFMKSRYPDTEFSRKADTKIAKLQKKINN